MSWEKNNSLLGIFLTFCLNFELVNPFDKFRSFQENDLFSEIYKINAKILLILLL